MRTVTKTAPAAKLPVNPAQKQVATAIPALPPRQPSNRRPAKDGGEYSGSMADLAEEATVSGTTSPNLGTRPTDIVESAVLPEDLIVPEGFEAPVIERFVVKEDKMVSRDKHRFKLHAGKVVDSQNYDLRALKAQGVKLITEEAALALGL